MDSRETGSRCFTCSPQLPTHSCCTGAEQGRVLLSEEVEGVEGVGVGVREGVITMLVLSVLPRGGWVEGRGRGRSAVMVLNTFSPKGTGWKAILKSSPQIF